MKAIFPGSCVVCGIDFVHGEEIADSGHRGPRGGKKMAHLGCVSRSNPHPGPGGMAIPGDYPDWTYRTGPDPVLANWTSYPQYSYESFYRTNPEHPEVPALLQRMAQIEAELQGVPQYSDAWFELQGEHNMLDRRVRLLRSGVKLNPSAAAAHPVPWKMPQNAGPYEPVMFPYGQGGRPAVYSTAPAKAKKNSGVEVLSRADGRIKVRVRGRGRVPDAIVLIEHARGKTFNVRIDAGLMSADQPGTTPDDLFGAAIEMKEMLDAWRREVHDRRGRLSSRDWEYAHEVQALVNGLEQAAYIASSYKPGLQTYYLLGREGKAKRNRGGFRRGSRGGYSERERESLPSSAFLKPSTRSWPVSDRKHAKIALQYMMRGFGKPSEYPKLVRRLAEHYPPEDAANRSIWTMYRKNIEAIEVKAGKKMPSPKSLRRMAAANPKRRRRRKKR